MLFKVNVIVCRIDFQSEKLNNANKVKIKKYYEMKANL